MNVWEKAAERDDLFERHMNLVKTNESLQAENELLKSQLKRLKEEDAYSHYKKKFNETKSDITKRISEFLERASQ